MKNRLSEHCPKLYFSLVKDTLHQPFTSANTTPHRRMEKSFSALWLQSGQVTINGAPFDIGTGRYIAPKDSILSVGNNASVMLRFIVSIEPLSTENNTSNDALLCETIYSKQIVVPSTDMLLRLDQVNFPPGAVAYKHTHPGPGIRYLVDGGLTLSSDHGEERINSGDAWFEEANSPVKATAINTAPSYFIRAMLLPLEYKGRSTFTLHDQTDIHKPRLQSNTRHFEKRINLSHIH